MMVNRGFALSSHDDGGASYLDSSFLQTRPRRHTSVDSSKRPGHVFRSKSSSNILNDNDDFHRRLYDPVFAPHLQKRPRKHDDLTELADFLRTQTPPPDNFMSIPDEAEDDERSRWLKWAKMAKRSKSTPRAPPQIRLPDTAVSGTTTGGHRHIAITIPLEAFPLGDSPRTQYPVYAEREQRTGGVTRTVLNERGVVTVLKPLKEGNEPSFPTLPRPTTSPNGDAASRSRTSSMGRQNNLSNGYPVRGSSRANTTRTPRQPVSIDGLLSQPAILNDAIRPRTQGTYQPSASLAPTGGDEQWPPKPRKTVKVQPDPVAVNGAPTTGQAVSKESGATILKDNPLGPSQANSGPPTPTTAQMRKEKVRERKRKDMEALWQAKLKDQGAKKTTTTADSEKSSHNQPTLSPIRVIVDVEPDPMVMNAPPTPSTSGSASRPISLLPDEQVGEPNVSKLTALNKESQPTPPASPTAINPPKHNSLDRTSLSRRREWKASREQERKAREARTTIHAKAKEVAAGILETPSENIPQTLDKEILRLYEAYRDHRFRDMERRVRRLERNGDVWLRALIPVLDNLNRTMGTNQASQQGEIDDCAYMSDGESVRKSAPAQYTQADSPLRRANSSHRTLQEVEMGQKADHLQKLGISKRDSEASDEMTGLDTIEPLMRELAGAAEWRQMQAGGLARPS